MGVCLALHTVRQVGDRIHPIILGIQREGLPHDVIAGADRAGGGHVFDRTAGGTGVENPGIWDGAGRRQAAGSRGRLTSKPMCATNAWKGSREMRIPVAKSVTTVIAGITIGAAAAPAAATPEHPTPEEINFVNAVRGNFPGDDAQLIQAGEQACTMLAYRMAPPSEVPGLLAARYGASPDQAASLVSAAHSIICPYLPG